MIREQSGITNTNIDFKGLSWFSKRVFQVEFIDSFRTPLKKKNNNFYGIDLFYQDLQHYEQFLIKIFISIVVYRMTRLRYNLVVSSVVHYLDS